MPLTPPLDSLSPPVPLRGSRASPWSTTPPSDLTCKPCTPRALVHDSDQRTGGHYGRNPEARAAADPTPHEESPDEEQRESESHDHAARGTSPLWDGSSLGWAARSPALVILRKAVCRSCVSRCRARGQSSGVTRMLPCVSMWSCSVCAHETCPHPCPLGRGGDSPDSPPHPPPRRWLAFLGLLTYGFFIASTLPIAYTHIAVTPPLWGPFSLPCYRSWEPDPT